MQRGRVTKVSGTVVSTGMKKTIVVQAQWKVKHPLYGKYVRRSTKYYAHDELGTAHKGDFVELAATRPISKLKRWRLVRVMRTAVGRADELGTGPAAGGEA